MLWVFSLSVFVCVAFGEYCNKALKDLGNAAQEHINAFLVCSEPLRSLANKMSFDFETLEIQFSIKENIKLRNRKMVPQS